MNNKSARYRFIILVGFVLATLACNSIMINNPNMAPIAAQSTDAMMNSFVLIDSQIITCIDARFWQSV